MARTMAIAAGLGAVAIAILPHTGGSVPGLAAPPAAAAWASRSPDGLADQVLLGMRAFHHTGRFLGFAALTIVVWVSDAVSLMVAARAR